MKKLYLAIFILNILTIVGFWAFTSGADTFSSKSGFFVGTGNIAALLAVFGILVQFFLMARVRWLESVVGLDKLAIFHKLNGKISLSLLFIHPFFITFGYALGSDVSITHQFSDFLTKYDDLLPAFIAFLLFMLIGVTSVYFVRNRVKYEYWYYIHLLTYAAILLSWGHQLELGTDFLLNDAFTIYWYLLYGFVLVNVVLFRFIVPTVNFFRFQFVVDSVVKENDSVTSIYITGKNLHGFKVKAGQFAIFHFLAKGFWTEAHPFSISAVPQNNKFRISVKALGDFTRNVGNIPIGTKVFVDGPYGVFTDSPAVKTKVALIAGGIGITPMRPLIDLMAAHNKDAVLIHANKFAKDAVFKDEIEQLAQSGKVKAHYVFSDEYVENHPKGMLNIELLKQLIPDIEDRTVFLCGPPAMMKSVRSMLTALGIRNADVRFEVFAL